MPTTCQDSVEQLKNAFSGFNWANHHYQYSAKTILEFDRAINERIVVIKNQVLSDLELNEIEHKVKSILSICSQKFKLKRYGSYRTGLCIPTSDLDLCLEVESDPSFNKVQLNAERRGIMHLLNETLKNETWFLHSKLLDRIKHPVLKFTGVLKNMKKVKIDITVEFKKMNAPPSAPCQAADLILQYIVDYPQLKPMAIIVKQFFYEWDLNDHYHGHPNSYCIVIMIVTFLGYALHNDYLKMGINRTLGGLLIDFFNFYGNYFDFLKMGIRYDYKEKVHSLGIIDDVPSSQKISKRGPNMVIDDPIVEENNVGSAVTQFPRVQHEFRNALTALTNFQLLIEDLGVTNVTNKSYLEAFLNKKIPSFNMQIPMQYSNQHALGWEDISIHCQSGYYAHKFLHEAYHAFYQPQILSSELHLAAI